MRRAAGEVKNAGREQPVCISVEGHAEIRMALYRLYAIFSDGHFTATDFDCADDDTALKRISAIESPLTLELWREGRLVKRIAQPMPS